jgi:hypothetical protein
MWDGSSFMSIFFPIGLTLIDIIIQRLGEALTGNTGLGKLEVWVHLPPLSRMDVTIKQRLSEGLGGDIQLEELMYQVLYDSGLYRPESNDMRAACNEINDVLRTSA